MESHQWATGEYEGTGSDKTRAHDLDVTWPLSCEYTELEDGEEMEEREEREERQRKKNVGMLIQS